MVSIILNNAFHKFALKKLRGDFVNQIETKNIAQSYLEKVYGSNAIFRDGQLEAITAVLQGKRALVVQKTGWGKSLIYFLSTKILRKNNKGLTIVISPLLALMNNQLDATNNFRLISRTINSNNTEEWESTANEIIRNEVDILFISPERLANEEFNSKILNRINQSIGMLVIDEAHCISDWGHDFRPDYRRIINIVRFLAPNVPLLATTATANDRVVKDIVNQLGRDILVQRGPMIRESLAIQVIHLDRKEERLAWLSENISSMDGMGIIYCLTKNDCNLVTGWLRYCGVDAYAYYSGIKKDKDEEREERFRLEKMFINNEMKVLVATTAFGMGIDKPDISFVIHFQKPGNVVAYYQQIGRAGRGIDSAYAILLAGNEDDEIIDYFIRNAFPSFNEMDYVIRILEGNDGLSINGLMRKLDITYRRLDKCLKFLLMNGDIFKDKSKYYKTPKMWEPDMKYSEQITQTRKDELQRMNDFININDCYMKFVAKELNDEHACNCNRCSNCIGEELFSSQPERETILEAISFIKKEHFTFEPRKKLPSGLKIDSKNKIDEAFQCEKGLALSSYGDAGWGREISKNKYKDNYFSDDLVIASAELLKDIVEKNMINWVTSVSSLRRPELVGNFAERLANELKLSYFDCIIKTHNSKQQKELNNSHKQFENVWDSFEVENARSGNVLLIDDMVDSRWTFTVCGYKMLAEGSGKVYPFALANTAGSGGSD